MQLRSGTTMKGDVQRMLQRPRPVEEENARARAKPESRVGEKRARGSSAAKNSQDPRTLLPRRSVRLGGLAVVEAVVVPFPESDVESGGSSGEAEEADVDVADADTGDDTAAEAGEDGDSEGGESFIDDSEDDEGPVAPAVAVELSDAERARIDHARRTLEARQSIASLACEYILGDEGDSREVAAGGGGGRVGARVRMALDAARGAGWRRGPFEKALMSAGAAGDAEVAVTFARLQGGPIEDKCGACQRTRPLSHHVCVGAESFQLGCICAVRSMVVHSLLTCRRSATRVLAATPMGDLALEQVRVGTAFEALLNSAGDAAAVAERDGPDGGWGGDQKVFDLMQHVQKLRVELGVNNLL